MTERGTEGIVHAGIRPGLSQTEKLTMYRAKKLSIELASNVR